LLFDPIVYGPFSAHDPDRQRAVAFPVVPLLEAHLITVAMKIARASFQQSPRASASMPFSGGIGQCPRIGDRPSVLTNLPNIGAEDLSSE